MGAMVKVVGNFDSQHEEIHSSESGSSLSGTFYCISFIDDYSRFVWIYFLRHKSKNVHNFQKLKNSNCD